MKNPAFHAPNLPYYTQEKRFLIHLIPDGPNVVLDLGCGSGRFGKALLESNKAREVHGVELFEPAAAEARNHYQRVHVGDIEELHLDYNKYFDLVFCGDVLEHLKEPDKVIKRICGWLKKGGRIVCCVPNVRYWRVWCDLVFRGNWQYTNEGILDQTHLRFFTTKSFRKMLTDAFFVVEYEGMQIWNPKDRFLNKVTGGAFRDFLGFQMVFSASLNSKER